MNGSYYLRAKECNIYILTDENIIKNPTFLFTDIKKNKINKYYIKINLTKRLYWRNYIDERDGSLGDF